MAGRRGEYLFKRAGSANWHIRFVYPPGLRKEGEPKQIEFSLRTTDRREAEAIAGPHIAEHKRQILLNSIIRGPQRVYLGRRFEPGRMHTLDDGTRVLATADTLTFLDEGGAILRVEPNVETERVQFILDNQHRRELRAAAGVPKEAPKPTKASKGEDTDMERLEEWVKHASVTKHIEREARVTFEVFKALTENKRFADAVHADGVALADHLFAQGQAFATVRKKCGHLRAIVNHAMKTGKHAGLNPFADIIRKQRSGDIKRRVPLDADDMAKMVSLRGDKLSDKEWLLWVLLATTGMRLEEAVTIDREHVEASTRYVIVGTKSAQSLRRVPLPDAVLSLLPNKITGPLFPGEHAAMLSKRMNRRMRDAGIAEDDKVLHSLRHRAKDRLRAEGVGLEHQYELLGHERKTVAAGYGHGSPMGVLKREIEKIGM